MDGLEDQIKIDAPGWAIVNKINITEFMEKTKSGFFIWNCKMAHIDCRDLWKPIQTHLGV